MSKLGNWHEGIGTSRENSPHREAPNKHVKGSKRYKEMIAKDTKRIDDHGNMPFTFAKPTKRSHARRDIYHMCDNCNHVSMVSKHTAGRTCSCCKNYTSVNDGNSFNTEEELMEAVEQRSISQDVPDE